MRLRNSSAGATRGNQVEFAVAYCDPPSPNPNKLGCYRSELALQRSAQNSLVDWVTGVGSSVRWFGFSNKLEKNYSADTTHEEQGPSLQMHGGGGLAELKGLHPVLNMQVLADRAPPRWVLAVASTAPPGPTWNRTFDLGHIRPGSWDDWVFRVIFSPRADRGSVAVWRNGEAVVAQAALATAYNDTVPPYLKFGVYKGGWKEMDAVKPTEEWATITYGALKVGDERSCFNEVSTSPTHRH
eukprot:g633.t1